MNTGQEAASLNATALALIAVAAVAHASWNLFSKQAAVAGAARFVWLMSAAATVLYAPVVGASLVIRPSPAASAATWPADESPIEPIEESLP